MYFYFLLYSDVLMLLVHTYFSADINLNINKRLL